MDVSRGKHTTPPKRSVMLLYRDKNGDFSVHWVTPRTLGQSSDCLTFSERLSLWNKSSHVPFFFYYVLSVLIICTVSDEQSMR